jgi:hypothetical protein
VGREIKRVALDFDWPIDKIWDGFLMPDELHEEECADCKGQGFGPGARHLHDQWYGNAPFNPEETGSARLTPDVSEVRAFAERNVDRAPDFYMNSLWAILEGAGPGATREQAIVAEARRLTDLWNANWCHHLAQADVDALIAGDRLRDFTHTWSKETGWLRRDPMPTITAADVNRWSLNGFGHDSVNAYICIQAKCERAGIPLECFTCGGHGSLEKYPGQREAAEAWEPEEPESGEGWQLWETISEGSPISPVFETADELSLWLQSDAYHWGSSEPLTKEQADSFIGVGWAPTLIQNSSGAHPGEAVVGRLGE